METQNEKVLDENVVAALRKFDECQSIDELTLEEVMMCRFKKSCRRVSPTDGEACGFERGSLIVLESEVLTVLLPEDNTMFFPYEELHLVEAPSSEYEGMFPSSKLFKGDWQVRLFTPEVLRGWRDHWPTLVLSNMDGEGMQQYRSFEAFGLLSKKSAKQAMETLQRKV